MLSFITRLKITATNPATYGSFLASETTRDFPSATQDGIPATASHDATRQCSSLFLGKSASFVRKEIQPNVSSSSAITASKTKLHSNFKSALAFGCLEVASGSTSSRGGANQNPFSVRLSLNAPEVCLDSAAGDREVYLQAHALVCRFTKVWPKLSDLHSWISTNWKDYLEEEISIYPCAKGFLILEFDSVEDREMILNTGPWFYQGDFLCMKPWFPLFDP